jgi:hypothetical protein
MAWLILSLFMTSDSLFIDFGQTKTNSWMAVNDGVMGGRSIGSVKYDQNALCMEGSISFENNGGFASTRSPYATRDLSGWSTVTIRYRCEGQSLGFVLNHYRQWYLPRYKVILPDTEMEWMEVTYNLEDFREYKIGQLTGRSIDQTKLSEIIRFGFITNDKKEGSFRAEIDFIEFR